MRYRNYIIERSDVNCPMPFTFIHIDYDGPEDNRRGLGDSIQDCKNAIDDAIEDAIYCEQCDSTGRVSFENRPVKENPSFFEVLSEDCESCSHIRERLKIELCSHVRDNQGFCHNCGVPICEETIKSEGLWKTGMLCDLSNE